MLWQEEKLHPLQSRPSGASTLAIWAEEGALVPFESPHPSFWEAKDMNFHGIFSNLIYICMESLHMKRAKTVSLLPGGHSVQFWSIEPECNSAFLWFSHIFAVNTKPQRVQRGGINGP